jgi:hypothetical protein
VIEPAFLSERADDGDTVRVPDELVSDVAAAVTPELIAVPAPVTTLKPWPDVVEALTDTENPPLTVVDAAAISVNT